MSPRRLPAEWEPQAAVWFSWPVATHIWPRKRDLVREKFAEAIAAASRFQPVNINACASAHVRIRDFLKQARADLSQVTLYDHPTDDVWCRDHGPIFVKEDDRIRVTDWGFNAWGGKFEPWTQDDDVPQRVAATLRLPTDTRDIVLEGGAIESNGAGALLTTDPVLLNPNRNPTMTRVDYERAFAETFGIRETIWLPTGLPNDDTDGHIDNLARFFAEDAVLAVSSHRVPGLEENRERLADRFGQVVELPLPNPVLGPTGEELPASYANFVVLNGAVLTPVFGQNIADHWALGTLRDCFPDREIVPIDCRLLLEEGGALHCLTANQPA